MKFLSSIFLLSLLSMTSCMEDKLASNEIAPENDLCICTKDYRPVCSEEGITYPNACQAKCEGVTDFTEGACNSETTEANE